MHYVIENYFFKFEQSLPLNLFVCKFFAYCLQLFYFAFNPIYKLLNKSKLANAIQISLKLPSLALLAVWQIKLEIFWIYSSSVYYIKNLVSESKSWVSIKPKSKIGHFNQFDPFGRVWLTNSTQKIFESILEMLITLMNRHGA